jgi:hypothetical protein
LEHGKVADTPAFAFTHDPQDVLRTIRMVISSLRLSVEMPFQAQERQGFSADGLRRLLLQLEEARLAFGPIGRIEEARNADIGRHLERLVSILQSILQNAEYEPFLRSLRFRMRPEPAREREAVKTTLSRFHESMPIGKAIERLIEFVSQIAPTSESPAVRDLFQLRALVPPQKIAPVRFDVLEGRLVVSKHASEAIPNGRRNILVSLS